ncbi:hypothetical protein Rsub_07231 [Raphidocelis subcapitata]|uniref:Sulfotransferase n=1 Tax=Raphidocelis subcapitata TaxID=307507 RepID=A0A2V0PB72_9CHLO|nr:hypothetical protein Rsub_07231 [Raphidocelis subcapitata]|eukprot:GBF94417.1 hypothetical protein Rsub_07231 [Raphidocelis subcapitata]
MAAHRGLPGAAVALLSVFLAIAIIYLSEQGLSADGPALATSWAAAPPAAARLNNSLAPSAPGPPAGGAVDGNARAAAVAACRSFACLRAAHKLPAGAARFNFPHAMIVGFPKCATTSLYAYLAAHPQAIASQPKEPNYFMRCRNAPNATAAAAAAAACPGGEADYLQRAMKLDEAALVHKLKKAAFEGSTVYSTGKKGFVTAEAIAADLRRELPWLKLVMAVREPMTQAFSGRVHTASYLSRPRDKWPPWFTLQNHDACLLRFAAGNATMGRCVLEFVEAGMSRNTFLLKQWMGQWPREQLHVMQYENFTGPAAAAGPLSDLQLFLGLDPSLAPRELPREHARRDAHPEGWPIKKGELERLLALIRPEAESTAAELERRGYTRAEHWLAPWRRIWKAALATCSPGGDCRVVL